MCGVSCTNVSACIGDVSACFSRASYVCVSALYLTCGFSGSRPKERVRIRSASRVSVLIQSGYRNLKKMTPHPVFYYYFFRLVSVMYLACICSELSCIPYVRIQAWYKHDTSTIQLDTLRIYIIEIRGYILRFLNLHRAS